MKLRKEFELLTILALRISLNIHRVSELEDSKFSPRFQLHINRVG